MGSSRLPGKVLMDLGGLPVLAWVVRAASGIHGIDHVIVATSDQPQDDEIVLWCTNNKIDVFRGDEKNVLARYYGAAQKNGLRADDLIMRLTADCPLLDPQVAGEVLTLAIRTGKDYVNNIVTPRTWPDGLDCEVFKLSALEKSYQQAEDVLYQEHVTLYIRRNPGVFDTLSLACPVSGIGSMRWTLDTKEDLDHIRRLVSFLDHQKPASYFDVLKAENFDHKPVLGTIHGVEKSMAQLEKALKTIPLATQTFSKSYLQHIPGVSPLFLDRGDGPYVWDIDGNQYFDYLSALLPVLLGYNDPDVNEAIKAQLAKGISFSLATELEAELAEMLSAIIPSAEMIKFGKNGSDATSAAVRLARAYTGREAIAISGYHSWHDWYIGTTTRDLGVPQSTKALTDKFVFNDIDGLKALLAKRQYAAIILEPEGAERSQNNFLEDARILATQHGAVLVFDEIVCGFRSALGGIQALRGVTPDLSCFGKAVGNGMPLSFICGKKDIMKRMDDIFFSGTFGGEALSLAAGIACLRKFKEKDGVHKINTQGTRIISELNSVFKQHNMDHILEIKGQSWWPVMHMTHADKNLATSLLRQELVTNGIIQGNGFNLTLAHCQEDVWQQTLAVWQAVAKKLAGFFSDKNPAAHLRGRPLQAIFQVR